jgi:hypothetical protein
MRRWPLAGVTLVVLLAGLGALGRIAVVARALATLARTPLVLLAVTATTLTVVMLRRRRWLARNRQHDWVAALPSDLSLTGRAALAPLPVWVGAVLAITAAVIIARLPLSVLIGLVLACSGGYLAAIAIVVLVLRDKAHRAGRLHSRRGSWRSTAGSRARPDWAAKTRLLPLGYWPVRQAKIWDRPKVQARSLLLLLLGLPLGTPGAVALAAATVWLTALHLIMLLLGTIRVAFAASWWLAPTPVGAIRFLAALSHGALARQIATCMLLVIAAYLIAGAPGLHTALASAASWLGVVCSVSAISCLVATRSTSIARSVLHRWMR